MKSFVTEESFWDLFPEARIGIVVAHDMQPTDAVSPEHAQAITWALAAANASPTQSIEQAHQLYIAAFARTCTHQVSPYPGVLPLLNQLQRFGIKTAVLSNKPHQQTLDVVARFFPQGLFQTIRGQVEGVPLKPNPQAVYTILESLAAHPSHCLYVGDTGVDMQTGQNAGLVTVGVEWGFRGRKELEQFHASHIIKEPRELLKLL